MIQMCSLCGRGFGSTAAWTNHRNIAHPDFGTLPASQNTQAESQTFSIHDNCVHENDLDEMEQFDVEMHQDIAQYDTSDSDNELEDYMREWNTSGSEDNTSGDDANSGDEEEEQY